MEDETEAIRREEQAKLNTEAGERAALIEKYGAVYDTKELQEVFTVKGFMAPYVVVVRKADGKVGSLQFQHHPRLYWGFVENK